MPPARLRLTSPEQVADHLRSGSVNDALVELVQLANVELTIEAPSPMQPLSVEDETEATCLPIRYRGETTGQLHYTASDHTDRVVRTAHAVGAVVEHMVDREIAISDLAEALMTNYEEMNLVYSLLPNIATKVDPSEIGQVLVEQTARTLGCRRVSLAVLDDKRETYAVLAACGLPPEAMGVSIPVSGSIGGQVLHEDDVLVVNDIADRPDLAARSRGSYDTNSFAVVRVPLQARGEALGFLTATERDGSGEFTARDRKLLDGLSAMGASAILNCRLHAAVNRQMMSTIHALASAVDAKDHYTHDHAGRVAQLCVMTARELGVNDTATCREVELAGLLHDIGKIGIPDAILSKPASLTPEEFKTIRSHTRIGARIVEKVPGLEGVAKAILYHHERFDGLGYPVGLSGEAIPLPSALISVVDAFDALTSDRPYRKSIGTEAALSEVNRCKGTQFDAGVVDAFVRVVRSESAGNQAWMSPSAPAELLTMPSD